MVRNLEGRVLATLRSYREIYPNALLGHESIADLKATILCTEMGLQQLLLEEDALSVVNAIKRS